VKMMFLKAVLRQVRSLTALLIVKLAALNLYYRVLQEIGWHDQPDNNTGKLMSRLSSDTMAIRGTFASRYFELNLGHRTSIVIQQTILR
jgi:uncharacterized membrane protein YpjA